jgi:hypothetical protein
LRIVYTLIFIISSYFLAANLEQANINNVTILSVYLNYFFGVRIIVKCGCLQLTSTIQKFDGW